MPITLKLNSTDLSDPKWDALKSEFSDEIMAIKAKLEQEHGPLDNSYTLSVVNFRDRDSPRTEVDGKTKEITINLPIYDMEIDKFQRSLNLAHEIVHTITPSGDPSKVTYLEEGLCTAFSEKYVNRHGTAEGNYEQAGALVRRLLDSDPKIIHKMRMKYPSKAISDYTVVDFTSLTTSLDASLLQDLTKPFYHA